MTDDELYHVPPFRPQVTRLPRPRPLDIEPAEDPEDDVPALRAVVIVMIVCVFGLVGLAWTLIEIFGEKP